MNKVETKKIMAILWAAYPGFYAKAGDMDKDAAVKLWQECFEEEPYDLVSAAVYALIKTRPNSFPPTIGEVTAQIQRLTKPDEMTELEAWNLVAKALRNSFYGAAEEFAKLPPIVQRLRPGLRSGLRWTQKRCNPWWHLTSNGRTRRGSRAIRSSKRCRRPLGSL